MLPQDKFEVAPVPSPIRPGFSELNSLLKQVLSSLGFEFHGFMFSLDKKPNQLYVTEIGYQIPREDLDELVLRTSSDAYSVAGPRRLTGEGKLRPTGSWRHPHVTANQAQMRECFKLGQRKNSRSACLYYDLEAGEATPGSLYERGVAAIERLANNYYGHEMNRCGSSNVRR